MRHTILGWTLLAGLSYGAGDADMAAITVHLYNNAGVSRTELHAAESAAGWMLEKAGIAVRWQECDGLCAQPSDPLLFVVSVNRQDPPQQTGDALGFALLKNRGNHAAALYHRISAVVARDAAYRDSVLLGAVIAHELGHLLLGHNRHGEGVMKASWQRRDFESMRQRRLRFTEEEAGQMRDSLSKRIRDWSVRGAADPQE